MSLPALVPIFLAAMHAAPVVFPNLHTVGTDFGWTEPFNPDKVFLALLAACLLAIIGQLQLSILSWGLAVPCAVAFGVHVVRMSKRISHNTPKVDGTVARCAREALAKQFQFVRVRPGSGIAQNSSLPKLIKA